MENHPLTIALFYLGMMNLAVSCITLYMLYQLFKYGAELEQSVKTTIERVKQTATNTAVVNNAAVNAATSIGSELYRRFVDT